MKWPFQYTAPLPSADDAPEQSFVTHLSELRDRILRMVLAIIVVFLCLFPFANDLYTFVAAPMLAKLPTGSQMIATQVASPFLTPIKLALMTALFVAMPYVLYQLWAFVAPGLYRHEKRLALPLLASSIVLFYVGMAFAYFVVFPFVFSFFAAITPDGVQQMPDIATYLDFVLALFLAFGVAFEVPIATILLVVLGITTPENLIEKRPYVIVGAFVVGMVLTPPDVVSQTLLALPMWFLYEAGVYFSRYFVPGQRAIVPVTTPTPPPPPSPDAPDSADIADETALDLMDSAEPIPPATTDAIDVLLQQAHRLRTQGLLTAARQLLYQVLETGNHDQRRVARVILHEMDQSGE